MSNEPKIILDTCVHPLFDQAYHIFKYKQSGIWNYYTEPVINNGTYIQIAYSDHVRETVVRFYMNNDIVSQKEYWENYRAGILIRALTGTSDPLPSHGDDCECQLLK